MTPIFLPHTALDVPLTPADLLPESVKGQHRLCALRDHALAEGAHVLLLVWPDLVWAMLAVEPPADVTVGDALELVPNLMANPEALEQMHQQAKRGSHLVWLVLQRPATTRH